MLSKRLLLYLFLMAFFCNSLGVAGQSIKQDSLKSAFAHYLFNSMQFQDLLFFLNTNPDLLNKSPELSSYYKGWAFYNLKILDSSAFFLSKVPDSSKFYPKSAFFAGYCLAHSGNMEKAKKQLSNLPVTDSLTQDLKNLELSGISLLNRDFEEFSVYSGQFRFSHFALAQEQKTMLDIADQWKSFKPKSPVNAALFSAILPGAGKIYAGKTGGGISAFLTVVILSAVSAELSLHYGWKHPASLASISTTSLAYLGNIYGSYYSVKAQQEDFRKGLDHRILYHMHIPLRNIFP